MSAEQPRQGRRVLHQPVFRTKKRPCERPDVPEGLTCAVQHGGNAGDEVLNGFHGRLLWKRRGELQERRK